MDKMEERLAAIDTEASELQQEFELVRDADPFDEEAFEEVSDRVTALTAEKQTLELRKAKIDARNAELANIRKFAQSGVNLVNGDGAKQVHQARDLGDVYDLSDVRSVNASAELRARALTAVERTSDWEFEGNDRVRSASVSKGRITDLIEHKDDRNSTIAKLVLATNSPLYKQAWIKAVTDRKEMMTAAEKEILLRAMSLTDSAGGFAVPMPIDPTLIQLGDGAAAGVRQYARVETTTVDVWRGLSSTEMTASWDAEGAEVSDDTTTFAQPTIPVFKASAFVPASIEIAADYPNLAGELGRLFADAKFRLEATAFATGGGTTDPFGIVTALDGTASEIASTTTDVFAIGDVYRTFEATGPRYRMAGVGSQAWASNISILNLIRQFGTANNYHGFTVDLTAPGVPAILGRPWFEMSAMDGTITALSDNNALIFGDWANYLIVDRVGFSVEFIPHLFHTSNNRPSGSRGWYAYWRTGADSINDGAFTMLNVT